mgnify:CR=1 FL=1
MTNAVAPAPVAAMTAQQIQNVMSKRKGLSTPRDLLTCIRHNAIFDRDVVSINQNDVDAIIRGINWFAARYPLVVFRYQVEGEDLNGTEEEEEEAEYDEDS